MAKGPKIKWNLKGFEEIRRSPEVEDVLQVAVDHVLDDVQGASGTYIGEVNDGKSRSRGSVFTADYEAMLDNSRDDTLLYALGSLRVGE